MSFIIRQGKPEDRGAVFAMLREFMDYFAAIEPGEIATEAELAETAGLAFRPDPVCSLLIAEREGRPVGYLAYHFGVWNVYAALYVAGLFVTADARKLGIGKALMTEARRLAAARGATHVTWTVWRKNDPAFAFYRRLGAEPYDDDLPMFLKIGEGEPR